MPASELIIGLIAAVGTDLKSVEKALQNELHEVHYGLDSVRLSSLLLDCYKYSSKCKIEKQPEDVRIETLMQCGDNLRATAKRGDALALLAISKVRQFRQDKTDDPRKPVPRHCFVLNSLKHPKEVSTLREVYGEAFVAISVYTPKASRKTALCSAIARSHNSFNTTEYEAAGDRLISRDEKATDQDFGQNVRDTFPEADVFLDASVPNEIPAQVKRFTEILFRHPNRTPTIDEYGLFHAKAAALRSADLSRQVGAVIANKNGELLATGCNEVPISGGGAYWEGQGGGAIDRRDFKIGYDSSAKVKRELLEEVFAKLKEGNWLSTALMEKSVSSLVENALFDQSDPILADTRVAGILEFGRVVHAEMSAITEAARRGIPIQDATLYCTTFPAICVQGT